MKHFATLFGAFALAAIGLTASSTPTLADPGRGSANQCYVWSNIASPALNTPFTPSATYSYNAQTRAAGNSVTRIAVGTYSVKCAGVGGGAQWGAGGHVQVTAYGNPQRICNVSNWATGGADFVATVRCIGPGFALADSQFDLQFSW